MSTAFAQTEVIVVEASTDKPVEMVSVYSISPRHFQSTDIDGKASIDGFKGAARIEFRIMGYRTQVWSYEELEDMGFRVRLEPSNLALSQIVVSAIRWRQQSRDIPAKVTAISKDEVAFHNPQTTADLLEIKGNVFIQKSQQGGGSPMIRGFSANRLLLSIDGVRMNTAIFRSGNIHNVISLDPFVLDQTEVLFGPGSVMYGSDALGGVLSFKTTSARLSTTDSLEVKGGYTGRYSSANNEITNHLNVNVGHKHWASYTAVTFSDFGDLRMGSNGPATNYVQPTFVGRHNRTDVMLRNRNPLIQTPSAYSQFNLTQKLRYAKGDWDFQYAFHHSGTSGIPRYDRLTEFRNGLPRSAEWHYGPQVWQMHHVEAIHSGETKLYDLASLRLAYQSFQESRVTRRFGDHIRNIREEQVGASSINLDFQKRLNDDHSLSYGLEYVHNQIESAGSGINVQTGEALNVSDRYPQANWQSVAAFLKHEFRLSERWVWETGVRYNRFVINADFSNNRALIPLPFERADLQFGALSGSTGWVYTPKKEMILRANLSTGFRAPNVDDIGKVFDSEPGAVVVPNPNLRPEYVYNAEIGIATIAMERLKVDFSVYATYLDQAMVRRAFRFGELDTIVYEGEQSPVLAIQNAAFASVVGTQFFAEYQISNAWMISATHNVQRGREETDDGQYSAMRHAPPTYGALRLTYKKGRWRSQLYAMYSGAVSFERMPIDQLRNNHMYAVDDNGNPYAPAWYTLNAKVQYVLNNRFTLMGGVENITDQRYRPFTSGLVAAGLNVVISVRASL
jgi:hemoglobin/transferrin/lactoferrin receptor protein